MSKIDEIMSEAQVFASAWSLVGGRFDDGSGLENAEECKAAMRELIAAALADARREGAEAMRDAAEQLRADADKIFPAGSVGRPLPVEARDVVEWYSESIRALPLPTGERQAVLLTDEQLASMIAPHWGRADIAPQSVCGFARSIESAVLAANNLEVRRG